MANIKRQFEVLRADLDHLTRLAAMPAPSPGDQEGNALQAPRTNGYHEVSSILIE